MHDYSLVNGGSKCLSKKCCLIFWLVVVTFAAAIGIYFVFFNNAKTWQGPGPSASSMPSYRRASVVSDAAICAPIGKQFLVKGGHAVDAAIATLLCNGVVNLHSMGIGGGGLMVIYNRSNKLAETLNFRETAPAAADKTTAPPSTGVSSIAVPSTIAGYRDAHLKYGRLPWKDLFQPTIDLLRKGVPVSSALAEAIKIKEVNLNKSQELKAMLYDSEKTAWKKEDDRYFNLKLAATLEKIANHNDPNSVLTSIMAKEIRENKGIITEKDIRSYQPKWHKTISSKMTKQNLTLHTMSVPSGGALVIYMLNILSGYNFSKRTFDTLEGASLFTHRAVEAMKFAYAKKSFLGDVNNSPFMRNLMHNLTLPSFAQETRFKITDDSTHDPDYYGGNIDELSNDEGTTHINVLDQDGNAVAVTSTINDLFGSFVMGAESGILYNNEMRDFSKPTVKSSNNLIQAGKSPMSSMSPIIGIDSEGNVRRIYGASGGSRIISAVGMIMARNLLLKETIKQAIDFPRLHHQWLPDYIETEKAFPKDIKETLIKRKHKFAKEMPLVAFQGIEVLSDGLIYSNADYRKGGKSDGY